mmetsp:Transcript_1670/g.2262  ORF Transcript_1670/g.2262 Transcript_1670/m.2262 type:complete len:218 (+) Transcript_1670:173-826(+)
MKASKSRRRLKNKSKQSCKPRRPLSAYNLFYQQQRKLMGSTGTRYTVLGQKRLTQGALIGALWRNLDQVTRCQYEIQATEMLKQYEAECAAWEQGQRKDSVPINQESQDPDVCMSVVQSKCVRHGRTKITLETSNITPCVDNMQEPQKRTFGSETRYSYAHLGIGARFPEKNMLLNTSLTPDMHDQQERIFMSIHSTRCFMDDELVNFVSTLQFEAD